MDEAKLRRALTRLAALGGGGMPLQERLDYLALLGGLKPVYQVDPAYADQPWVDALLTMAAEDGLAVVERGPWLSNAADTGLPDWFEAAMSPPVALQFVARAKSAAASLRRLDRGVTPEAEAKLLGYPPCCVTAHHRRASAVERAFYLMLSRAAAGDEARMRALLTPEIELTPETDEEIALVEAGTRQVPCRFVSWFLCEACDAATDSVSQRLSERYARLALAVDADFARQIEEMVDAMPTEG